jgi:uncharacterized iron-regulated membrane protein
MAISGIVVWWKRRPAAHLGLPLYPRNFAIPKATLGIGTLPAICFPLGGAVLVLFAIVDYFLPNRLKEVGAQHQKFTSVIERCRFDGVFSRASMKFF